MFAKLKKNYFLLLSTFLFLYFFFNLLDGERGLISYFKKKNLLIELKTQEFLLLDKISDLEFKNSLLTERIDLDYIETLIREKFLFGENGEKLYIIKKNDN
tara:strand:+ start:231 stop:533 length:303 start_codon:yes stop_codon:yes gene_type:complete